MERKKRKEERERERDLKDPLERGEGGFGRTLGKGEAENTHFFKGRREAMVQCTYNADPGKHSLLT